jgi:hypothetical protein
MNDDEYRFFSIRRWPARLTVEEVAWFFRCRPEDVQALVRARLLKPLGNPAANGKKLYRTKEILELADDPSWLNKMTNALYKRWRDKNASRTDSSSQEANGAIRLISGGKTQ